MFKPNSYVTQLPSYPPGPTGQYPLALMRRIQKEPLIALRQIADQYDGFARFRTGPWNVYLVAHPNPVREILRDQQRSFSKNTFTYNMVKSVAGPGLLTLSGEEWRTRRRLMQPIFSKTRIDKLDEIVTAATERMLTQWQSAVDMGMHVDAGEAMNELTLGIAAKAFFDVEIDQSREIQMATNIHSTQFSNQVRSPLAAIWGLLGLPTITGPKFRHAHHILQQAVRQIIEEMRQPENNSDALVAQLACATHEDTGIGLTDADLQTEVLTLLIAGHETSAKLLTWALYLLSRHEEVFARLQTEIRYNLQDKIPSAADVAELPFLNQVIDETLRLYPSAWAFSRRCEENVSICGFHVPKGARILVSPYLLHRHPEFWPNPDTFDPNRFSSNIKETSPAHAFIPFGAGPRQCIGKRFALVETRLILAQIAARFTIRAASQAPVQAEAGATLSPESPIQIVLSADQ